MNESIRVRIRERRPGLVSALLMCGIGVALAQIVGDIVAARLLPGYSYLHQSVSELSAIGASTRPVTAAFGFAFEFLVLAFAAGCWLVAEKRGLKIASIILGVFAVNALVWGLFPMQQRGSEMTFTDYAHIGGAALQVLTIVLFIAFGSGAGGARFRAFSIAMIVAILGAGALAGTQAGQVAAGAATPWLGLIERISFYGPSIWILVLSLVLLGQQRQQLAATGATEQAPTLSGA